MGRLFGTDGIRGIANTELGCDKAMVIGRATATVLSKGLEKKPTVIIGSDTRASSEMLGAAVSAGICSAGANVIMLGVVPTPAVAHLVKLFEADAGVMISASHNPFEYNGIKIFNGDGFKLPDELEEEIEDIILGTEPISAEPPTGGEIGRISYKTDSISLYLSHLKSSTCESLDGLNIAIDCANGSASVSAEKLFVDLGANVHMLSNHPNGVNINKNCGSTHMDRLQKYVVDNKLDCGLAFDGDADRFLCVDELGNIIDGDMIMAICALDMMKKGKLRENTVVGTIMTNFGFTKFCDSNGIKFIATKVGDRFVLEEMNLCGYALGGEQSGHIIFRDFATTGDGQLTAVQLLSIMVKEKKKLSELASVMTKAPQTMINLKISANGKRLFYTDATVKKAIDDASAKLGSTGRIVVRPSGTEPLIRVMAEGEDLELIENIAKQVADIITLRLGNK